MWANLLEKLAAAAHRLAGVALEHGDALELIARYDQPDTVIYCDPPYAGPLAPRAPARATATTRPSSSGRPLSRYCSACSAPA